MKYILSSLVIPCTEDCVIECKRVSLDEAREFVKDGNFVSAVGHKSTAELLSELLGVNIECNRIFVDMKPGDEAIAVQFLERIAEGRVLSKEELEKRYEEGKIVFRHIRRW